MGKHVKKIVLYHEIILGIYYLNIYQLHLHLNLYWFKKLPLDVYLGFYHFYCEHENALRIQNGCQVIGSLLGMFYILWFSLFL